MRKMEIVFRIPNLGGEGATFRQKTHTRIWRGAMARRMVAATATNSRGPASK